MEDIDKAISTLQKLIGCTNLDQVQMLLREFEDLVGPTEETNLNYESVPSIDQLNEQTKAFMLKVEKLSGRGMFPEGIAEKRGDFLTTSTLAGQTTAIRNMEMIYDFIIGDVKKIGVYGMGGIGKTTVMKHINNRILKEQKEKFDHVIWVTVSKESSVLKLQDDIAENLKVNLSNCQDTTKRAATLFEAFKNKGRCLLILDDLWEYYSLEEVGIPDPNHANGCKLVLTTRLRQVCQRMECETIKMDLLSEEEALALFLVHVGRDVLQVKGLEPIVKDVASECARLPLAIATIATSMRGQKEACEWRVALERLRAFSKEPGDMGKQVIEQLKFSYDRLENKKLQKCLLLCALYPEDKEIERRELIELLALDGIIEEKECKSYEVDEGNVILNNLINQCLLEGGENFSKVSWVKMHDLVRDMAVQINSLHSEYLTVSGINMSNVKWSEKLLKIHISGVEMSNVKWSEKLLKIHISNWYSSNVSQMCPRLTTFILKDNFLENIPHSFFQHFNALKVLNLSGCNRLQVLPNSISNLVNLVGLLLRNCYKLIYVPPLTRLKDLQTLDLSLCDVKNNFHIWERKHFLIKNLKKLSNLRYVNLMSYSIEVFPLEIIPRLSNLRYLVCNPLTKVNAGELMRLKNLEMFKGAFHDIHDLCVYVKHIEQKRLQLISYVFIVGQTSKDYDYCENNSIDKVVILKNCNLDKLAAKSYDYLHPKDVQRLEIQSHHDLISLCSASLNDLRECTIRDCNGVRELVSTTSSSSFVLPSLERLHLENLKNLEALIGRNKTACNVFPCLRQLYIQGSDRMKVVINIGLLSNLDNLEFLFVFNCKEVEEIIGEWVDDEKDVYEGIPQITLPNLRKIRLINLPHLRYICPASRPLICMSLQSFNVFPCLQHLEIQSCSRMKVVINIGLLSNLNNLEVLVVEHCKKVEEIIGEGLDEEKDVNEGITQISLPNLRVLQLHGLPHLRSICPASTPLICKSLESFNVFPCLQELYIRQCDKMKVVINIGLLSNLNNLEELYVRDCKEVEEIIGEGLDDEKDVNEGIPQITLPNLRKIRLINLPHLRYICPASRPLICMSLQSFNVFPCLQHLEIQSCSRMKVVINIGLLSNLNNLEILKVDSCYELEEIIGEWLDDEKDVNEGITQITLPNLKQLDLVTLPHLRCICPASRQLTCKSLKEIRIVECPEVEQCVYVSWDERDQVSTSDPLRPIELKKFNRSYSLHVDGPFSSLKTGVIVYESTM